MTVLNERALRAARAHARRQYPEESCGLLVRGQYRVCENVSADPESSHVEGDVDCRCRRCSFRIEPARLAELEGYSAVIHSHPGGPAAPSQQDMEGQLRSGVPWVVLPLDEERDGEPIEWGDSLPMAPLIGRQFVHGVADCYTLIRDVYRVGSDALEAQGVVSPADGTSWPYEPIVLEEVPRSDAWWTQEGVDLYSDLFRSRGFEPVLASDVRPGDVFLTSVRSEKFNHGGVYIGGGLILDHRPARSSRREPLNIWARTAQLWIRHACGR